MSRSLLLLGASLALLPTLALATTAEDLAASIRANTTGAPDFSITPPSATTPTKNACTDFGLSTAATGAANYTALVNALSYCKSNGIHKLIVNPGTYNLGDSLNPPTALIDLEGFSDFTFDGGGALFLCQAKSIFVQMQNCQRVVMTNYSLDWDWTITPVQSLTQVQNVASDGSYIDLYYPHETNPAASIPYELAEVDGTTYDFSHQGLGVVGKSNIASVTALSSTVLRYTAASGYSFTSNATYHAAVGQYYVARHFEYNFPGTKVNTCSNITFQNVITYSTLGMGYIFRSCDHIQFQDSKIIRRPNTQWPWRFSSAADGIHFENNHGYIKLLNVEIGNAGDDAVNIHDTVTQGIQYTSNADQLQVTAASDWQYPFAPGDTVELRADDFSPVPSAAPFIATVSTATFTNVSPTHWTLTFGKAVPTGLASDTVVFNDSYKTDNYIVENCNIHHNKVRGMVVHNANGTIENNAFIDNYCPGLFIITASTSYKEGKDPTNIVVRNNIFDGNDIKRGTFPSMPNNVVIAAETPQHKPVNYGLCQNIIVEGNTIKNCPYAALEVASASNVLVDDNTIENPNLYSLSSVTGSLMVLDASNIVATNNMVIVDSGVNSYYSDTSVDPNTTSNVFADPLAVPVTGAWANQDVGPEPTAGTAAFNNGTFTVTGTGSDIWNASDQFDYVYQPWQGDGQIVAHVASVTGPNTWSKAGIMFREALAPDSQYAQVCVTPGGSNIALQYRNGTGSSAAGNPAVAGSGPTWIKLVRSLGTFFASLSSDGATWSAPTVLGNVSLSMASDLYVGLAVTSKDATTSATGTFDHVIVSPSWTSLDIGTVGQTGSSVLNYSTGVATVKGSGADIWGMSDAFQYFCQPANGDAQIVAQVTHVDNTNAWAKAAVMMRNGTSTGAANATLFLSPGNGVSFQGRPTDGVKTATIGTPVAATAPWWLKLVRSGGNLNAYQSSDGNTWTWIGTQATSLTDPFDVGLAVTSKDTTQLNTSTFANVTISNPWTSQDIGAVGVAGTSSETGNSFTVSGSGADIYGSADSFRYVWQPLYGNGSIIVHVTGIQDTDPWAKAGIMIRETLDAGSKQSILFLSPEHGIALQGRETANSSTTQIANDTTVTGSCWLKLERTGSNINAYKSTDNGSTWQSIATEPNAMNASAYIGLAVCSKNNNALNTATFDSVVVTPEP